MAPGAAGGRSRLPEGLRHHCGERRRDAFDVGIGEVRVHRDGEMSVEEVRRHGTRRPVAVHGLPMTREGPDVALDSGVTYQFRFEPEGQHYLMIPYESDVLAAPDASSGDSASTLGGASFKYAGKLPEDIRFAFEEDVDGTAERLPDELLDGLPDAHDLKDAAWSPPLLFYPDGTAIDAAFRAIDSKSQLVRLSVRGLTGAVTVSSVEMEDER